jgi:hypothetical protein
MLAASALKESVSKFGFDVNALLPFARGGGQLKMGLHRLSEEDWLQAEPDLDARRQAFAEFPEGAALSSEAEAAGRELAQLIGAEGGLTEAALASHEDMCLMAQPSPGAPYHLIGAAVAWPSDWRPAEKLGLPLRALHAPIEGYEDQLASSVDVFMDRLRPDMIFARANWFITPTGAGRWNASGDPAEQFAHITPENAAEALFVRCERQTLRRLSKSGVIVFTIGIYNEALRNLSPANVQFLAKAMKGLLQGEGQRRGARAYAEAVLHFAEQQKRG